MKACLVCSKTEFVKKNEKYVDMGYVWKIFIIGVCVTAISFVLEVLCH